MRNGRARREMQGLMQQERLRALARKDEFRRRGPGIANTSQSKLSEEADAVRAEFEAGNLHRPRVRSDDPHFEDFDADVEREPLEDKDGWHE